MFRCLCKILLFVVLFFNLISFVNAEIEEGFITKVDLINNKISINDDTYILSNDCLIKFNNNPVTLSGLKSPYPNYYKWAIVDINNNVVIDIDSYYKVVEGEIREISVSEGWIVVSGFQQDSNSKSSILKYYFPSKFSEILKPYRKQDYIVMVTALEKILYLP